MSTCDWHRDFTPIFSLEKKKHGKQNTLSKKKKKTILFILWVLESGFIIPWECFKVYKINFLLFYSRVVTRSSEFSWPNAIIFSALRPSSTEKKFENTSVSVYLRGVSITTKGQFLMYLHLGRYRKFYWLCRRFPWLLLTFLTDNFFTDYFLTFLTCDIAVFAFLNDGKGKGALKNSNNFPNIW